MDGFLSAVRRVVVRFSEKLIFRKAAALTFFSLLTIVPCLAAIVIEAKCFSMDSDVMVLINSITEKLNVSELPTDSTVRKYIDNGLNFGNWDFLIGLVLLLWSVCGTYYEVERMFNEIWETECEPDIFQTIKRQILRGICAVLIIGLIMMCVVYINNNCVPQDHIALTLFFECLLSMFVLLFLSYYFIPCRKRYDDIRVAETLVVSAIVSLLITLTTTVFGYIVSFFLRQTTPKYMALL